MQLTRKRHPGFSGAMDRDALLSLSRDDLIALILAQAEVVAQQAAQIETLTERVATLTRRVAELEAKLGQPPKTPSNSSLPPSQRQKRNRAERRAARRKSHLGAFRALSAHPDRVVETFAATCPHCAQVLSAAAQPAFHAYDHVELPPLRPIVTRIQRHRGLHAAAAPSARRRPPP